MTKIVCTIGPASASSKMLEAMMRSGMNVARLNFSHGTHESHKKMMKMILAAAKKVGEPVALLADIQGPKIRLGNLPEKGVELKTGATIRFTTATDAYTDGALPVTHKAMHTDVKKGNRVLVDDGNLEVRVTGVSGRVVTAKVVNGGVVTSHKGMNFPDSTLSVSPITKKDREDVAFAVTNGVQWVAMSFVTRPQDVKTMRTIIAKHLKAKALAPKIIVKIEKHEALKNFDAILKLADAIMVARGDLGVETPPEDVPLWQKTMIAKCRKAGKPVVVATQMLDSMIRNPRPTRAEVSDVANAVIDHTDAIMLSGESATGKYPKEAVDMMRKISIDTEASGFDDIVIAGEEMQTEAESFAGMLAVLARIKHIDAILTSTAIGPIVSQLNQFRPQVPMFLAVGTDAEARQWNIRWGLSPFVLNKKGDAIAQLRRMKKLKKGQTVALVTRIHGRDPEIELHKV